ncbi:MAG: GTP-binding protein [Actinomycetota bacterium]
MDDSPRPPIPLTILTGFLGAGKTTLLNHILTGDHGLRVGVLVNDFGSINVDADLVVDVEDGVVSLANGCVCCQIRDDLIESVATLVDRDDPVDYVVLEASGVADPAGIYLTFVDSSYRDRIRLDSVTCVVDADQALGEEDAAVTTLKLQQIGFADLVILNKIDLAGVEGAAAVKQWIDSNFTRVRVIPAIDCDVPLDLLLSVGRFDPTTEPGDGVQGGLAAEPDRLFFSSQSYVADSPMRRRSLERMIKRELPATVYRCKGFVHLEDDPAVRYVLQVVGRRVDLVADRPWGSEPPRTRLVAIAHGSALDSDHLAGLFDACVVDVA